MIYSPKHVTGKIIVSLWRVCLVREKTKCQYIHSLNLERLSNACTCQLPDGTKPLPVSILTDCKLGYLKNIRGVLIEIWTCCFKKQIENIDGLVQERRNSIANALELRLSCTNPSTFSAKFWPVRSGIYDKSVQELIRPGTSICGAANSYILCSRKEIR